MRRCWSWKWFWKSSKDVYKRQVKAGVFLGTVSAAVRERLWAMVKARADGGSCLIAYAANNEQGFCMEVHGDPRRTVIDFDGLQLIKIKQ